MEIVGAVDTIELEETGYWLELLGDAEIVPAERLDLLRDETEQLTAILVTCAKNARERKEQ